ncbi:MAG TPA: hypothetical protein VFI20_08455, partial [Terracidiphilus sp.]|nr:hypothetical protein [Terracidiphilus sp.]
MAAKSTTNLLAVAALLVTAGACTPAFARSPRKPAGVRTGKATDAHPTGNMPHAAALPGPQAVPNLLDVPVAAVADPIDAIPALELQSLPLTGSAWQDLALGAPPAATRDRPDGSSSSRGGDAGVTVDGVSIRLAFGAIRLGSTRTRGVHLIGPVASESSIRQVEDASGGASMLPVPIDLARVRVATESGTNAVHGRGALFTRQSILSAQDPYSQWVRQTGAGTATTIPAFTPEPYTSSDTATIWSFGVGGPVRRNRMYWFASLNSRRRNHPGVATVRHPDHFFAQPSNDQMQVLSARLGLSSANPVVEGLAAYSGMLQTLAGLLGPASRAVSLWSGFGRFDWQAGSRFRLTLEGTGMHRDAPGAGLTRTSEMYGARSFGSHRSSEQWMLGRWEAVMTPHLLAVTQVSAARHIMDAPPQAPSAYEQTLNVNAWGQLPQISIDTRYGFTIGKPSRFGAGSYPDERMIQAR